MCGLFGFLNYSGHALEEASRLINSLAEQSAIRGTDATGMAFNEKGRLVIHKEPKSAFELTLKPPEKCVCVTSHVRHTTQGDCRQNYNNHPFEGRCKNVRFALCHNGIISNDKALKSRYNLRKTHVQTDSFVAVQLLEKKKVLNAENIRFMAETVEGSFSFSILDSEDNLWLIKGDSPLSIVHLPARKLYLYASTETILFKALVDTPLFEEVKQGRFEEVSIQSGEILKIQPDGKIIRHSFTYREPYLFSKNWWSYGSFCEDCPSEEEMYIQEIKDIVPYYGHTSDDVDALQKKGLSAEEIESLLCGP